MATVKMISGFEEQLIEQAEAFRLMKESDPLKVINELLADETDQWKRIKLAYLFYEIEELQGYEQDCRMNHE